MSPELQARLRRINIIAVIVAAAWVVASAVSVLAISHRMLADDVGEAAVKAVRDSKEVAQVVERMFSELEAIPQVLATNRHLRETVGRYDKREPLFAKMSEAARRNYLINDREATRAGSRLSQLRDKLGYELLYVLDNNGIRIISADWDRDQGLLGTDLSDREYFKESMALKQGHQFAISRTASKPALFFSAPVEDDDGSAMGVVVVRQTSQAIGSMLASGQHSTLVVDKFGMVVATSKPVFYLRHVPVSERDHLRQFTSVHESPDAGTLKGVYGLASLPELGMSRPVQASVIDPPVNGAERLIDGRRYLVASDPLKAYSEYSLFVLTPIDWVGEVLRLHYAVGALVVLAGVLIIMFFGRRIVNVVHHRHDAEVMVALNKKLTAANLEKNRFLGIAAHDLRNPLSSIRGLSQLMVETPMEPPEQKEFLETIHRTSDETLGLVNDLLDVAVIESGKLDIKRKDQDVAKLVGQRVKHLEPHARSKNIAVTLEADGMRTASIDGARFAQVVDNLVSNAIKFSPPGTTVTVALRADGENFTLSVQDQGPGIPEEERKLLFRSFQKLSARPTGGEKSTGLGLAIVKKVVDAHGGRIEVDSAPGRGTRFIVTAPIAPAQGAQA